MAKKQTSNPELVAFLDKHIAQKEKQIIEHNGTVPHDFEQLERYFTLRDHYVTEAAPKEAPK